jgi:alpha-L-rhamnosidase
MIKKIGIAGILLLGAIMGSAQVKWPSLTPTSKPWTRWWWLGSAVNKKDITANMEQYKAVGLGGLEITPIYGVKGTEDQFVDYLSHQWMQLLDHTLQESKRLNLGIDMATGTGWPFGGGPLIGAAEACKDFVYKTWSLKGGEKLQESVSFIQEPLLRTAGGQAVDISKLVEPVYANKNLQALALDQVKFQKPLPLQVVMAYPDNGPAIDLTSKVDANGNLNWTAPAGNWTLYALFMGWHGKMVERAAPGGEGNSIDHFSLSAIKKYFSRFDKAFTGHSLTGLRGFFNDSYEVDDARGQSNWTPGFFDEFVRRRGYDLKQHLPALLQKNPDENSLRVLYDYRQTISDLLLEKFTTPWHDWAKAKGKLVRNQSHGSPANIMDLYGAIDIPETEGTELLRFKFATSATHVLGKPLASAEAATWLNEHFKSTLADVKVAVDNYFLGGVNHIVYHGTSYSPQNDPWPGWLFYAAVHFQPTNPFWKDFTALNNYITRCQSFLQSGKPDNDILLYFPFSDKNSTAGRDLLYHYDGMNGFENTDFKSAAEEMLSKGYAFDLVSDKQLQLVANANALLKAPGGTYKTILLANTKYLPLETLQKLVALGTNGATIIIEKNFPADVPGLSDLAKRQAAFKKLVSQLHFTDAGSGVKKAAIGKGAFIMGDDINALMNAAHISRESMVDQGLECVRRQSGATTYYFIANKGKSAITGWVPVTKKTAHAIVYDAMREKAGLTKTRKNSEGATELYLQLTPGESCVVSLSNQPVSSTAFPYIDNSGSAIEIPGTWTLKFTTGGPTLPATQSNVSLGSWTELPGQEVKKFSGTAQYTIHFAKPASDGNNFLLDLGKVEQSAEVWLNGKKLATLIGPTFQVIIPASQFTADNVLQVNVSNGMANRIIDMEKRGVEWKKFYNVNFPARLAANRDANGLFTAIKWQPEASGLLGPVTLTPVSLTK